MNNQERAAGFMVYRKGPPIPWSNCFHLAALVTSVDGILKGRAGTGGNLSPGQRGEAIGGTRHQLPAPPDP